MKRRDIQDLKQKSFAELEKLLREGRERLRVLRFDLAAGKVKNVKELRTLRKNIARMSTIMQAIRK
jgi:ribosomal protein L29